MLDRYLLYAPASRLLAAVNTAGVREAKSYLASRRLRGGLASEVKTVLRDLGAADPDWPWLEPAPLDPVFLGIIPSRRCNMSCRYCDFRATRGAGGTVMAPATATAAIDFIAEHCERRGQSRYRIQLFGGEPMVEDLIVDTVVHHALHLATATGVVPTFVVSTNGLLTEPRLRFVGDYFDQVVVSIDGFRELHDRYRPITENQGSFAAVYRTAKWLSTASAELCLRCCVTADSVHHLESIAAWFCEELSPAVVNFEPLTESAESREAGLVPPHPYDFARHSLRAWNVLRSYGCEPACAAVLTHGLQGSSCPVGKDALIVHPNGTLASCYLEPQQWEYRGLDLSVGHVEVDGQVQLRMPDVMRLRRVAETKQRCAGCFCRLTCAGGCHVNNTYPQCSTAYGDFCLHTRILTACGLLEQLGYPEMADQLVTDPDAMDALSRFPSDRIEDFNEAP